ncbi:GntR family transcriptional regulator [Nocardioides sp. DS6]|uniref:GntR family transcriptional regulator n=1 Tax=Nocardioides eburneus TaxID=3231482 RepID=A0ABV3ST83_9ACTN
MTTASPLGSTTTPTARSLDRSSGVPLYRQIKDILCDEILSGARPGDEPMTEEELIHRFGVSRAPVRQALKELAAEGYVYRERARGTFPVAGLSREVHRPDTVRPGGLVAYLRETGLDPVSRVWGVQWVTPTADQADRFKLADDEQVLHFTRLISVDTEPLACGEIWLRAPREFRPSVAELEESGSAFSLLEREFGIVVARVQHEAWATAAAAEVAELLGVADGTPVLDVESIFYTREGRLSGWRLNVHRPDQFKFRFTTQH